MERTELQQIQRIWDKENIRHTMNRLSYAISNQTLSETLDTLWAKEHTPTLGYNNGFYVGKDSIRAHLSTLPHTDTGDAAMETMSTPLIILSEDGETAQFLGYRAGFSCRDGNAYLTLGLCFADLIREGETFRIWHMILTHDHTMETGKAYRETPAFGWEDPMEKDFGTPDILRVLQAEGYGWEQLYYDMPKAYTTYHPRFDYGPDGDFGKRYFDRQCR